MKMFNYPFAPFQEECSFDQMDELLLSDEVRSHPSGPNRILVVVRLPRAIAEDVSDWSLRFREERSLKGNPRPTGHLHVTLFRIGDFRWLPGDIIAAAERACLAVAARSRPFPVQVDQAVCGGKKSRVPFVLKSQKRNSALDLLRQRVFIQLDQEGIEGDKRERFEPHVTVGYMDKGFRMEPIEPIAWMVEEIVLIHSLVGQTQYIELGRWKLGA
jgi:2'-5' RNA ligase